MHEIGCAFNAHCASLELNGVYCLFSSTAFCVFSDSYRIQMNEEKTFSHSDSVRFYRILFLTRFIWSSRPNIGLTSKSGYAIDKILPKNFHNFIQHMTYLCPFVSAHSKGINSKCHVSKMHAKLLFSKEKRKMIPIDVNLTLHVKRNERYLIWQNVCVCRSIFIYA